MSKKVALVIGNKETFLVRVILKKLTDAGFDARFSKMDVNSVGECWGEVSVCTLYLELSESLDDKFIAFLNDKLLDEGKQMIVIGDRFDIDAVCNVISKKFIFKTFCRPLDADDYIESIQMLERRIDAGDYRKSILIVDDDPGYLNLVRGWLKDSYNVAMVTSGLQALKWLGKNSADLILLDYEMPVTSGPQVLEMLRSDPETSPIPVIFLTGKGDKESVMSVLALKPQGYFLKTIDKMELRGNIRNFFKKNV